MGRCRGQQKHIFIPPFFTYINLLRRQRLYYYHDLLLNARHVLHPRRRPHSKWDTLESAGKCSCLDGNWFWGGDGSGGGDGDSGDSDGGGDGDSGDSDGGGDSDGRLAGCGGAHLCPGLALGLVLDLAT